MKNEPVYKQMYNDFLKKISSGVLKAGDRLPSEAELCKLYKVSRITSKRALDILADQGYISKQPGKGSFVIGGSLNLADKQANSPKTIGFIIPDFSDSFGTKLIYGIEERCAALGYQFVLRRTKDQVKEEEAAINALSNATGILLIPTHGEFYNSEILKLILDKRALVFVDRKMRGLAAPTVSSDNIKAGEEGIEYLLSLGHKNIAFFSIPVKHTSTVEDRRQGFIQGLAKYGINHNPSYFCQDLSNVWNLPFYSPEKTAEDVEIVAKHLKKFPEISAAFTVEYTIALIVKAAVESLNRRIPKDFSIITFDSPPALTGIPPFTYLCQDEYTIGKEAVEALHRIITQNDSFPGEDTLIPMKLITGASTGPA
ncbi:MAG: GntR family transcriptional regulator [Spirochaetaceae bacterium]|nr:GntR family transcriptional regulator [Spirochaetaceae bacterium]